MDSVRGFPETGSLALLEKEVSGQPLRRRLMGDWKLIVDVEWSGARLEAASFPVWNKSAILVLIVRVRRTGLPSTSHVSRGRQSHQLHKCQNRSTLGTE